MKKIKIAITVLLSALCCAVAAGCGEQAEPTTNQLAAPQNFRIVNNKLIWDSVKNATSYSVGFYGTENVTTRAYLDLPYIYSKEAVTFSVRALGNGETFSDSEQVSYSSRMDTSKITKGLTYVLDKSEAGYTVSGNNKVFLDEIVIPAYYEGLPVIKIEPCAFAKLTDSHQSIGGLEVIVDPTITTNATLKSVRLPATLKTIAGNSFAKCVELTEITIPEGVTVIAANAFENCKKLRTVHFPDSLKIIGMYAFRGCSSLTRVKIPEGCEVKIGAFDESVKFD